MSPSVRPGRFIVLEGIDGSGKSSQIDALAAFIRDRGHTLLLTREPGGSPLAERLRSELLNTPMDGLTELMLVNAARRSHLQETIWPALARGEWVVCDRFSDSTRAYQGAGRGMDLSLINQLDDQLLADGPGPDLLCFFDLPAEVAEARRQGRAGAMDRFEAEGRPFFQRVRQGFLAAAQRRADRLSAGQTGGAPTLVIDSQQPPELIQNLLQESLLQHCF